MSKAHKQQVAASRRDGNVELGNANQAGASPARTTAEIRTSAVERAIAEAIAQEGADVVIWIRNWNDDDRNEAKMLPITQLAFPSQSNGASFHASP